MYFLQYLQSTCIWKLSLIFLNNFFISLNNIDKGSGTEIWFWKNDFVVPPRQGWLALKKAWFEAHFQCSQLLPMWKRFRIKLRAGQKSDFEKWFRRPTPARMTSVEKKLDLKRIFNAVSYCQCKKRLGRINIRPSLF